jgi:CHAT domain-containing protein
MIDQHPPGSAQLDDLRQQIRTLRGSTADTPRRAELCRQALKLVSPQDDPKLWAGLQFEWGFCLIQMTAGDHVQNLENAIDRFQQALKVYTVESYPVEWASVQHNLGAIYGQRSVGKRVENQAEAIRCYECALTVFTRTAWPKDWADVTFSLANVYAQRIGGVPQDNMERAIAGYEAALSVYTQPVYPLEWAKVQYQLGKAWSNYHWHDLAANLDKAQRYYQAALSVLTLQDQPVEWSMVQNGLGKVWLMRITGNHDDNVTQAIHYFEEALQIRRREIVPDDWADTMHNLGVAYLQLARGNRAKNVERAIDILTQALEVQTPEVDRLKWAELTCKLADAFFARIDGGRAENLQHAIQLYRSALLTQERHGTPQDWGPTLHNLAIAYSEHQLGTRTDNLAQAATCGKLALSAFKPSVNLSEWANVKTNLMDILWKLANSQRHSDPAAAEQNMEDAIAHGQDVLYAMKGQAPSQRQALAQYNLGNAYGDRLAGDRADNQTQAIWHYEQALQFYTRQNYPMRWADTHNNLGVTYQERVGGNRARDVELAISHFEQALTVCTPDTAPVLTRRVARNLGNLYFEGQRWPEAVTAYRPALESAEHLYRASLIRSSKEVELVEMADLYRHAAYALACSNDCVADACVALEKGRTRLLAEVLERNRADLEKLKETDHSDLFARYQTAVNGIAELEQRELRNESLAAGLDLARELDAARTALQIVIAEIQQLPGYRDFFVVPAFDQIQRTLAAENGAGVYVIVTSAGGLALIVHQNGVQAVWLKLTEEEVNARLIQRNGEQVAGGYLAAQMGDASLEIALDNLLPLLGDKIMRPIAEALKPLGTLDVTLIPCGRLALFPLHAAEYRVDDQTRRFMDDFTVTYTPSARALNSCRAGSNGVADQSPKLLGVGNPLPLPKGVNPLIYARSEVEEIARQFGRLFGQAATLLCEQQATREAVDAQLGQNTYLHLACHGTFNAQDPLQSGVLLSQGEMLTLKDLLSRQRLQGTRLVVLSACQTAITDFNHLPEEAIGLPAGFVQAGVSGVIGTLWPVDDASTMLLMMKFYEYHWSGQAPASALRNAQRWLRDVSNASLSTLFERLKRQASDVPNAGAAGTTLALAKEQFSKYTGRPLHERPFAHPYYWAPFVFYGA